MKIEDAKIIVLPKFLDSRGNLSFAENYKQIPFEIKRTYWLYDVLVAECAAIMHIRKRKIHHCFVRQF